MFPSVAAQGTFVTGTNFAAKKQESVPQFQHFVSETFPTAKAVLSSLQRDDAEL